MALYRAGQTNAEWLRGELQRQATRRVPQRAPVYQPQRGAPDHRSMEDRLQHQPTAHEPQRAHTNRVRSTPQGGAKLEQTLLMNEGKLGSRSSVTCKDYGRHPSSIRPDQQNLRRFNPTRRVREVLQR